ncbi:hypothetical protein VB711_00795 [Cronbergia sp. UHCC 0137]|uniref:hypothetical protein n=1 Tax=Cronbergia sp. UHCC 0137 TaxID=3110239 RepID=UPI002B202774|nr:hypothetical protein [Cronbergia sp. UHCC 0137]MEA5616381.1 hypothetical protein [Cronbergia sp. UHCC 0137]
MSVAQVQRFYEALILDQSLYEQYVNKCCWRGFLGSFHWDKTKIINFAATLGYNFNESELEELWFYNEPFFDESINLSEQRTLEELTI